MVHLILTFALVAYANAHALMSEPPQRGILGGSSKLTPDLEVIPGAPKDFFGHFPAGDKTSTPGAGKRSQEIEGNFNWTPYDPLKPGFKFRAGVCGDLKSKPEHLRGGEYYFGGRITRTYKQGGIIKLRQSVVAHHNGFAELFVCDVKKCGGEISEGCFRQGFCYPLMRAPNPVCDTGMSEKCAPIDSEYPNRWYLPCTSQVNGNGYDDYKGEYALFKLPDNLSCDHCVIQWFYTAANNCNPPGVVEYFEGPDGPKNWGQCPGQAGALGGYTKSQNNCGEGNRNDQFPEEYYQCADIAITRAGGSSLNPSSFAPSTKAPPAGAVTKASPVSATTGTEPTAPASNGGVFKYFRFIADGVVITSFTNSLTIDITRYNKVAIEVVVLKSVSPVDFYLDGRKVWDEGTGPYFLYGNSGLLPNYFSTDRLNAVINRTFKLEVRWTSVRMAANIRMTK